MGGAYGAYNTVWLVNFKGLKFLAMMLMVLFINFQG